MDVSNANQSINKASVETRKSRGTQRTARVKGTKSSSKRTKGAKATSRGSSSQPTNATAKHHPNPMLREQFLATLRAQIPRPTEILSAAVNRAQLYQKFGDNYLPKVNDRLPTLDWIIKAAQSEQSPALIYALSCICVQMIYRLSNDLRQLQGAAAEYVRAITCARREICKPQPIAVRVVTTHVLSMCELFSQVSVTEDPATAHAQYLLTLTETSHSAPDALSPGALIAAGNVRIFAVLGSIILRRCPIKRNELAALTKQIQPLDAVSSLVYLALSTASITETSDHLCSQAQTRPAYIYEQLQRITEVEEKLHKWITNYSKHMNYQLYRLTAVDRQPPPSVRGTQDLFRYTYEFNNMRDAIIFTTYWMCLVALLQTQLKIMDVHQSKIGVGHAEYVRLRQVLDEYADSLCIAIPYLGRAQHGWAGRLSAIRPLHFLSLYFQQQNNWEKQTWVAHCAEDIGSLRPKPQPPPDRTWVTS